jgi:hypothetical protein
MPDGSETAIDLHAKPEDVRKLVSDAYNAGGKPQPSDKPSPNCIGCINNEKGFSSIISFNNRTLVRRL